MTDPPVCDPCQASEHWDCTPAYDPDTDEVYPCACAETGHDPGLLDQTPDVVRHRLTLAQLLDPEPGTRHTDDTHPLQRYL